MEKLHVKTEGYRKACELSGTKDTDRQLSKWSRGAGAAARYVEGIDSIALSAIEARIGPAARDLVRGAASEARNNRNGHADRCAQRVAAFRDGAGVKPAAKLAPAVAKQVQQMAPPQRAIADAVVSAVNRAALRIAQVVKRKK